MIEMIDTKKCPSCNEDVPVLAVRCKYCGMRIDPPIETLSDGPELPPTDEPSMIANLDDLDDLDSELDMNTGGDNQMTRVSAPPPPRRVSTAPGPLDSGPPLPNGPPSVSAVSSAPPPTPPMASRLPAPPTAPPMASTPPPRPKNAPPGAPGAPKRTMLGMAPPAVMPPSSAGGVAAMAHGAISPDATLSDEVFRSLDSRPAMPAPLLSTTESLLGDDDLDALDLDDDILDDDLDEISKFTEQTAITDVSTLAQDMAEDEEEDDLPADLLDDILEESGVSEDGPAVSEAQAMPPSPVSQQQIPPGPGLQPNLSPAMALSGQPMMVEAPPMMGLPPLEQRRIKPITLGVIVLFGLIGVSTAAYMVLSDDEDDAADVAAAESFAADGKEKSPGASEAKGDKEALAGEKGKVDAEKKKKAAAISHKCKPISDYPSFPWSDKLKSFINATKKKGICGLFGLSRETVATTLRGKPSLGPTGYDLLPGGALFEVFPLGDAKRRSPTIEYIFVDDALFEIRLKYQMSSASDLSKDVFASAIGKPKKDKNDPLNREIRRYQDGDMLVTWIRKEDAYKRVFNEIVFSSKIRSESLKNELAKREEAMVAFEQAMSYFNKKQPMRAIDRFRKARKIIPSMGMSYIFEGITALQSEDFTKAAKAAKATLDNSTDVRAQAGAKGLQAVVALFNGEKNVAMELFKNAATLDPTDPEFSTSMKELKTGKYNSARVAKTAARMSCKQGNVQWTSKGLLARGNFPDNTTFVAAKNKAKNSKDYKRAFDMWTSWECN
jgi:tetratricopeptide (TPR) repeat protein